MINKKIKDGLDDFTFIPKNDGFYIKHKNGKVYNMYFKNEMEAKDYLKTHLGLVTSKIGDSKIKDSGFEDLLDNLKK